MSQKIKICLINNKRAKGLKQSTLWSHCHSFHYDQLRHLPLVDSLLRHFQWLTSLWEEQKIFKFLKTSENDDKKDAGLRFKFPVDWSMTEEIISSFIKGCFSTTSLILLLLLFVFFSKFSSLLHLTKGGVLKRTKNSCQLSKLMQLGFAFEGRYLDKFTKSTRETVQWSIYEI